MSNFSELQTLQHPLFEQYQLQVQIKRDDLIDPIISGNKWRKLKYNLKHVKENGYKGIISFGGAYSNHIHALAFACNQHDLHALGIIRGEAHYAENFTLSKARKWGMTLHFVDRQTYRERNCEKYLQQLSQQFPDYFIIPEGGSNVLALRGVAEICHELNIQTQYDTLITPVGSAGTISGLISGDNNQHNILGIAVLKQTDYLTEEVSALLNDKHNQPLNNWQIFNNYHDGGYAKFSPESLTKLQAFSAVTGVPFEPIYSGKMILALLDLINIGYFQPHHKIVLLHTGGLQGLGGLIEQNKLKASEWPLPLEQQVR
ncbi:1-aminocyclopropane-1-carboxylate deaminase/D-cysteine desulfhydrase [Thalassotalea castellviae]|uniref:Pyridoxal-phosphate dependent enzyme n=1 Tax=Thalassotalea castellviae TaxID=3075612 RepID=A0ABU2ZZE6_9GAMM|nr:pyridoxal-phosphate dependent enzyme [Thalassotalea sp. W431]MDT0603294.1 pyridoxal-phosphate dependent enzyme [Thalassotalea sp. W431]